MLKYLSLAANPWSTASADCGAKYLPYLECYKAAKLQHLTVERNNTCQYCSIYHLMFIKYEFTAANPGLPEYFFSMWSINLFNSATV